VSERIGKVKSAVEQKVGGLARHVESRPIREMFRGKTVWEGVVETFDLTRNPKTNRCYAWSYEADGETQYVTVSATVQISSPELAVRAFIASQRDLRR
jgi:hypothetical protein